MNRVTHIINQFFPVDYSKIPDGVMQNSQDFGNAIHKLCELYLKGTLSTKTLDPQLLTYLSQFVNWIRDSKIDILGYEQRLESKKYGYSGKPDIWGKIKNRYCVVDIKTTTTISKTIGLQLSGYELLLKELIGGNIQYFDRYILRLYPDKFEFFPVTGKSDMRVFLACMAILNYKKEKGV